MGDKLIMSLTKLLTKQFAYLIIASILFMPILTESQVKSNTIKTSELQFNSAFTSELYLYFPTTADTGFPEWGFSGITTSPANPFNIADLDSTIGTTSDLIDEIVKIVKFDYREFDVQVTKTTSSITPTDPRWQIAAIGSDSMTTDIGSNLFGIAQDVDTGDADAQDNARIYAKSFLDAFGGPGEAFEGAGSTFDRWATTIASTTSHEVAHNYGIGHNDGDPKSGTNEDAVENHIMATSTSITAEQRATLDRHFSDTTYSILGHNIGLSTKTALNWDFKNPNDVDANSLEITLLSKSSTLTLTWIYSGGPWENPTVAPTGSTVNFRGESYNEFTLLFTDPQPWAGGADGVAPPGEKFHIGLSFAESDFVVYGTQLNGNTGNALPLSPRFYAFDTGTLDETGILFLNFLTFLPPPINALNQVENELLVKSLELQLLPRLADINSMVDGAVLVDMDGRNITAIEKISLIQEQTAITENTQIEVARLTDPRLVDFEYSCDSTSDGIHEVEYCKEGYSVSLFPSTYMYFIATVVDPNAHFWDKETSMFVDGPLEQKVFFQVAGSIPDLNDNGIDDLIDLRIGEAIDENDNGVPDEAESTEDDEFIFRFEIVIFSLFFLIPIIKRKNKTN